MLSILIADLYVGLFLLSGRPVVWQVLWWLPTIATFAGILMGIPLVHYRHLHIHHSHAVMLGNTEDAICDMFCNRFSDILYSDRSNPYRQHCWNLACYYVLFDNALWLHFRLATFEGK